MFYVFFNYGMFFYRTEKSTLLDRASHVTPSGGHGGREEEKIRDLNNGLRTLSSQV